MSSSFPQRTAGGVIAVKNMALNGLLRASRKSFLSMRDGAGELREQKSAYVCMHKWTHVF